MFQAQEETLSEEISYSIQGELVQPLKTLVAKPDHLSLIPRAHLMVSRAPKRAHFCLYSDNETES